MEKELQKDIRREMFDRMEADLRKTCKPEERMFALHPDEGHIVVSHALFLMMSKPLTGKLPKLKGFYLLRKFEEEMLTAYQIVALLQPPVRYVSLRAGSSCTQCSHCL